MIRAVFLTVLIAFTLASGGFHKLVDISPPVVTEVSSTQDILADGLQKCCNSETSEHDFENPRCIGDNCISSVVVPSKPEVFSNKLRFALVSPLGNIEPTVYLRPPIS